METDKQQRRVAENASALSDLDKERRGVKPAPFFQAISTRNYNLMFAPVAFRIPLLTVEF